ncbi:MAG: BspA family leucine-rich repeat surface protein, partial [bacterium]|nr:BspA family leucine-rich repeat surface protein [bacterium]
NQVVDNEDNIDDENVIKEEKPSCTYDGELKQGAEYVWGQYTYRYMQEGGYSLGYTNVWNNISLDGWGVQLTDKSSVKPVNSKLCSSINGKPIVSMSYMFWNSQATTLDLSSFDTSKVTDMNSMFYHSSATSLNLNNFDTSNVTSMANMFDGSKVTTLDLSSFDTSKVTNMSDMFYDSQATTGYARTKDDADKFNSSINKPSSLTFATKNEENNSKDEYAKAKELFIYFVKEYNEFRIYTREIDDSEYEYIDSYKCINDSCKYSLDKNILAVYDDNKVLYKDLNEEENFKESKIEKTYKYYDKINKKNKEIKSYKIMNDYFFVVDNKICLNNKHSKASFHENGCKYFNYDSLEAGYVMIIKNEFNDEYEPDGMIYDINKEKIVYTFDHYGFPKSFFKEEGFYILAHNGWSSSNYEEEIFLSNFKYIGSTEYYYIKNNVLYYMNYEEKNKLNVIDENNNIIDYPNKDIKALAIDSSYLLYLDKDNLIKIKNLDNDKIVVDSNIKIKEDNFRKFYIGNNGNFYIAYLDISVKNTKKWKELEKENKYLSAAENAGYLLEINQNNELLTKEVAAIYYVGNEIVTWSN